MHKIEFNTHIKAPVQCCYDLARSMDFHKIAVPMIKEEAIAGCAKGLIGPNEHVLIQSTVGGVKFSTEMKLSKFAPPYFMSYEIVNSVFKSVIHDYYFYDLTEETVMVNHFYFETRFGIFGELLNLLFLKKVLTRVITHRNNVLKEYAETDKWKMIITEAKPAKAIVC